MIIEFTVGNFRSIYEKRTLSFEAESISEFKESVIQTSNYKLLPSIAIYGANSSGKSNVIGALRIMFHNIRNSVKLNDSDKLFFFPFELAENSESEPTFFEIIFLDKEDTRFRYGFEYNQNQIVSEWLFTGTSSSKTEKTLFLRTEDGIDVRDVFKEGKGKEESTNDNRLFLSLVAQLKGEISNQIIKWFNTCGIISGIHQESYENYSLQILHQKKEGHNEMLSLFQTLELGFQSIQIIESKVDLTKIPKEFLEKMTTERVKELKDKTQIEVKTVHAKYDNKGKQIGTVLLDKDENESDGTNKIMDLSGPIIDALRYGKLLVVDELDAKLHPLITIHLIKLFNNPETNPNHAQLLFATHDTNLLSSNLFRRDQIWFTEKDEREQTDLYSLYDINLPDGSKVRNDANVEKNYIRGRYGAIPFIQN